MKTLSHLALGALFAAALAAPAAAQVPLTPRALGMGGAYVAVARGNESIFLNPANLGLSGTPHWSIALPQLSLGGSMLGPTFGDFPDMINFDDITDARRQEILNSIPASGTELQYDLRFPVLAFQNGHFGLGVSYGNVGQHTIGRDLVELIFLGYEDGRTDYSVGETRGSRASFWDVAAAYGRKIGPVSLGVTGHYIHGGSVLRSRLFEPRIYLDRRDIEVDYLSVYAKGGQGWGVDFGMAVQPIPSVTLSGSVSNAVAEMKWSDELWTRSLTISRADFDSQEGQWLYDRYKASEQQVDPSAVPLAVFATAEGLYDQAYFPAIARLGAAWQSPIGTHLAVGYQEKLTEGRLAGGWGRMASAGVQQKLPLGTLRAGYATDLGGSTLLSGGMSLGPLQLGVAKVDEGELSSANRSGWIGTFGISTRTRGESR